MKKHMKKNAIKRFLPVALMLLAGTAQADSPKLTLSTGLDYSTGKYGQAEETKIKYVPFTAKYEMDRWTFRSTIPYIEIDGPANVLPDSRVVIGNATRANRTRESGLGDVVVSAFYSAYENTADKIYMDIGAKVKLPTADEKRGLGSGKTDYSLQADLFKTMGQATVFSTLGYKFFGDPTGVNLKNVPYATLGLSYKLSPKNTIGTAVDVRSKTTETATGLREYSIFYSHKIDETYKVQTYLVTGDTRSSVDLGGGAMLAVTW